MNNKFFISKSRFDVLCRCTHLMAALNLGFNEQNRFLRGYPVKELRTGEVYELGILTVNNQWIRRGGLPLGAPSDLLGYLMSFEATSQRNYAPYLDILGEYYQKVERMPKYFHFDSQTIPVRDILSIEGYKGDDFKPFIEHNISSNSIRELGLRTANLHIPGTEKTERMPLFPSEEGYYAFDGYCFNPVGQKAISTSGQSQISGIADVYENWMDFLAHRELLRLEDPSRLVIQFSIIANGAENTDKVIDYIKNHKKITEVNLFMPYTAGGETLLQKITDACNGMATDCSSSYFRHGSLVARILSGLPGWYWDWKALREESQSQEIGNE